MLLRARRPKGGGRGGGKGGISPLSGIHAGVSHHIQQLKVAHHVYQLCLYIAMFYMTFYSS
jgi:hypothetical protein